MYDSGGDVAFRFNAREMWCDVKCAIKEMNVEYYKILLPQNFCSLLQIAKIPFLILTVPICLAITLMSPIIVAIVALLLPVIDFLDSVKLCQQE